MATMRDVAILAGVSTATVSHVVNGSKKISPETTERVLRAISQVNYKPNTLAKSLTSGDCLFPVSSAASAKRWPKADTRRFCMIFIFWRNCITSMSKSGRIASESMKD